jgi:hypothetical protein
LELPHPAEPIRGLIKALFDQCEKDKPKVQPNEAADKEYCKNFALTVFNRADKLDRAKRADINTAKCFYAAAIFLQVCAPPQLGCHVYAMGAQAYGLLRGCSDGHGSKQASYLECNTASAKLVHMLSD